MPALPLHLKKGSVKQLHPFWATLHDDITKTPFPVPFKLHKKNMQGDSKCAQSRQHVRKINLWGVFMHAVQKMQRAWPITGNTKSQEAAQMQFGKWGRVWTLPPVLVVKAHIKECPPPAGSQSRNIWKHSLHYDSMIKPIYNRSVASLTPTGTYVPLKWSICGEKETWQFLFHCRNTWLAGHWHDSVLMVMLLIFNEVALDYVWFCDLELNMTSTASTVNLYLWYQDIITCLKQSLLDTFPATIRN